MTIHIVGSFDKDQLYCAGSLSKLLTTYVSLSELAKTYDLAKILDDDAFFDDLCTKKPAREFLKLFQTHLRGRFSLHDVVSYYVGLPRDYEYSQLRSEAFAACLR